MPPVEPQHTPISAKAPAPFWTAVSLSVLAALVFVGLAHFANLSDWIRAPDAWSYDWRTAHFARQPAKVRDDITVITIDEASLERYTSVSPVSRGLQAKLVAALEQAGAKAIGLDFVYDRATTPEDDAALVQALKSAKIPIVIGALDSRAALRDRDKDIGLGYQETFIAETGKNAGHLYFFGSGDQGRFVIGDQVIRNRIGPSPRPPYLVSFAEALAQSVGATGKSSEPAASGTPTKPRLIDWQRPPASGLDRDPVSLLQVTPHKPGAAISEMFGKGWDAQVRGRIVLIGGSFGDRDRHLTPFSVIDRSKMPGVLVHAQILAQLIDGREVRTVPVVIEAVLLVAVALIAWRLASSSWSVPLLSWVRIRPDAGGVVETFVTGVVVFVAGVIIYAATGFIFPSATFFLAVMTGLLLGNPPGWVACCADRFR